MANVRKPQMLRSMLGMNSSAKTPSLADAQLASGPDNVPAMITDQMGTPKGPAMIKEGEIIFSVEAVIGAGKGDYERGAALLTELQEELRNVGLKLLEKNSLTGLDE